MYKIKQMKSNLLTFYFIFFLFISNKIALGDFFLEKIRGDSIQGGLIIYKTNPQAEIFFKNDKINISPNGFFVIAFHRDDKGKHELKLIYKNKTHLVNLYPKQRKYLEEKIQNLPKNMVSPSLEILSKIKKDIDDVKRARMKFSKNEDFIYNKFKWPLTGRITGVYGSKRILNGKKRQPHYGIDIATASGTIVRPSASGRVVLSKNLHFTGFTIIIDHGYFLSSTYSHLSEIFVKEGEFVNRKKIIGLVGSSGRSTGPHLDWRINWKNKRLDPKVLSHPMYIHYPISRPKR